MDDLKLAEGLGITTLLQLISPDPRAWLPDPLTDKLRGLYASEACLELDLATLLTEVDAPAVRQVLSDHRDQTRVHIRRLLSLLPGLDDQIAREGAPGGIRGRRGQRTAADVLAGPLRAARAAIAAYRSATIMATDCNCGPEAMLLNACLVETIEMSARLAVLSAG